MKIVSRILTIVAAALVALLAIANRQPATVSLHPLPFEVTGPLYALLVAAAFIGFTVGGIAVWPSVRKWRRISRTQRRELANLEQRLKALRADAQASPRAVVPRPDDPGISPAPSAQRAKVSAQQ